MDKMKTFAEEVLEIPTLNDLAMERERLATITQNVGGFPLSAELTAENYLKKLQGLQKITYIDDIESKLAFVVVRWLVSCGAARLPVAPLRLCWVSDTPFESVPSLRDALDHANVSLLPTCYLVLEVDGQEHRLELCEYCVLAYYLPGYWDTITDVFMDSMGLNDKQKQQIKAFANNH